MIISQPLRIDLTQQTSEEKALATAQSQLVFSFNHTMPGTEEYAGLMKTYFYRYG